MPSGGANLAFSKYFPWVWFHSWATPNRTTCLPAFYQPQATLFSPESPKYVPALSTPKTKPLKLLWLPAWLPHPLFPPTLVLAPALCISLAILVHGVHPFVHLSLQKAIPHLLGHCSGSNSAISSGSNLRKPGRQLGLPRKKNKMCLRENRCTTALGLVSSNNTSDEAAKIFWVTLRKAVSCTTLSLIMAHSWFQ